MSKEQNHQSKETPLYKNKFGRGHAKSFLESHCPSHVKNQKARRRVEDLKNAREMGMTLEEYYSL